MGSYTNSQMLNEALQSLQQKSNNLTKILRKYNALNQIVNADYTFQVSQYLLRKLEPKIAEKSYNDIPFLQEALKKNIS